jgi:chemotaxis protein methyltransferase CheR
LGSTVREHALGRLRSLAEEACGFSLEQVDDDALLFKLDAALRRCGGLHRYVERLLIDEAERQAFVEALCTHETRFFRHPAHFEYLADVYLPALAEQIARGKRAPGLRAWSVACSTGEEPVSIAISACEKLGIDAQISVLGTDLSRPVLERAQALRWPIELVRNLPQPLLARYFLKGVGTESGFVRPIPRIRSMLSFAHLNLVAPAATMGLEADLIFCRNVLIYFGAETRARVAHWLITRLAPDGVLIAGPSEGFTHVAKGIRMIAPHIYERSKG